MTITGDYNAFFNNGTNLAVDGAPGALPFSHIVASDPSFVDLTSSDFHLRDMSPLRDAGDPTRSYDNQHDLDGVAVPQGQQVDIGAFEYLERPYRLFAPIVFQPAR